MQECHISEKDYSSITEEVKRCEMKWNEVKLEKKMEKPINLKEKWWLIMPIKSCWWLCYKYI